MQTKNTVYILRSDSNQSRHYTGLTSDLEKRLKWHNAGQNVDTARDRPWTVVVAFHFADERVARRFERYPRADRAASLRNDTSLIHRSHSDGPTRS